jgi:hypothetical protein
MPRSVNTSNLQNAFAQLGASNSRLANLEFQDRERRRQERGQIGGIIGGAIGSSGGPAGAEAGSMIGSKIAGGDVSSSAAGARLGRAIATQRSQSEQEDQQKKSLAALQQARSDAANQRQIETGETVEPSFFESFQPAGRTSDQIAQDESLPLQQVSQTPGGFQPVQDQQFIFPQQEQRPGLLNLETSEIDVAPVSSQEASTLPIQQQVGPTQDQIARANQEQSINAGLATLRTAPLAVDQRAPVEGESTARSFIREGENRLAIEEKALADKRLSNFPQAFAFQQARVNEMRGKIDATKLQIARDESRKRTPTSKEPTLFSVSRDGETLSTGLNSDEARSFIRGLDSKKGVILEEVGRPLQKRRGEEGREIFGSTLNKLNQAATPQEVQEIIESTDYTSIGSLQSTRLARLAEKRRTKLQEKESGKAEREIKNLEPDEAYDNLDKKLEAGEISFNQKDKLEKQVLKKEERDLKLRGKKAYKEKEKDSISSRNKVTDILSVIEKNADEFGSTVGEQPLRSVGAFLKEKTIGLTSDRTKVKNALSGLQLFLSSSEIKGVLSDQDIKLFKQTMPSLDSPQGFVEDWVSKIKNRIKESWEVERTSYKNQGRFMDLQAIKRLDSKLGFSTQKNTGPSIKQRNPPSVQFQSGKIYKVGNTRYKPRNQAELNAIIKAQRGQ